MKNFLLFLSLNLISISFLFAQGDKGIPEVNNDQWEVGMDVIWLLKNDYYHPTVFIRKNTIRPKKQEFGFRKNAYRLSLDLSLQQELDYQISSNNLNTINHNFPQRHTSNQLSFRLGYEWSKKLKSLDLYYGNDLYFGFLDGKGQFRYNARNNDLEIYKNRGYSIGIIPFVGLKYKITNHILASIEGNLWLIYNYSKANTTRQPDYEHEVRRQYLKMNFVPVRMIAISYLF